MISGQESATNRGNAILQRRLQHQREEAAEYVTADGLVELVEDRPGGEQVLGCSKGLLHRPQLLVAEHGLERIEIGVGPQNEEPSNFRSSSILSGSIAKCSCPATVLAVPGNRTEPA